MTTAPARWAAAIIAAFAAAATPAAATCNAGAVVGTATVAQAIDGRTVRLTDGREVRLAGLAPWPESRPASTAALARLADGHRATLHGDDAPDRYGRQTSIVVLDGTATSVQAALLAEGAAVASGLIAEPGCAATLAAAEATARTLGRGLWSDPAAIKNAERPQDILAKLGQFAIVEGTVRSVRTAGTTTYINFGRRWTRGFAVTIPRRALASFAAAGLVPTSLARHRVRVRGIVARRGGPRIEAVQAAQIELMNGSQQQE